MKNFLIFGMPRSMTAWISCFLTCGKVFCQHEICGSHSDARGIAENIRTRPFLISGMADPAALLLWRELTQELPDATLIYVRRSPLESQQSLATVAGVDPALLDGRYQTLVDAASEFCQQAEPHRLEFHDLAQEHWLRILWGWVAGDEPLPEEHLRKMMSLHVRQRDELIQAAARHVQMEGAIQW